MKIAIQGHPTRGKEVIQILESLGGINDGLHEGNNPNCYYELHGNIIWCVSTKGINFKYYTLEEFEKEFPFKIGDRVISATTNFIGTITKLKEHGYYYVKHDSGNLICVSRQYLKLYKETKEERNITLTLDKAKEWYKKGGELREIALQAFTERELNPLPKSWEEFCENHPIQNHEAFINYTNSSITVCKECAGSLGVWKRKPEKDRCKCPSQKSAEAHLAMMQLEQLRNCWWNGWEPMWDCSEKWCIRLWGNELGVGLATHISRFLTFPTNEMAREFLECFRDLIEQAKDLI